MSKDSHNQSPTSPLDGLHNSGDTEAAPEESLSHHDNIKSNGTTLLNELNAPVVSLPVPPDGGYGWVITFSGFMLSLILDGVCFSMGLYMEEFIEYFGESKAKTAWISSVLNGMYLTIGPIVSAMCNKFGCRPVALMGSVLAAISCTLSIFSPNIDVLILLFGFLGGFGFGMLYLPAIVMVGFYFTDRRAFATGITVCGSGIGGLLFAPLTEYMIAEYGWKGSILITSGLVFNCIVMSALLRPLKAVTHVHPVDSDSMQCMVNSTTFQVHQNTTNAGDVKKLLSPVSKTSNSWFRSLHDMNQYSNVTLPTAVTTNPTHLGASCDLTWIARARNFSTSSPHTSQNHLSIDISRPRFRKDTFYISNASLHETTKIKINGNTLSSTEISQGQFHKTDNGLEGDGSVNQALRSEHSLSQIQAIQQSKEKSSLFSECSGIIDVSVLSSPTFIIYGSSCFLCMMGFFVPFTFVPILATSKNFSKADGALLISIMSGVNVIGRLIIGWVSDQSWANPIYINSAALILGGLATSFYPYYNSLALLGCASAMFGLAIATFVSLRSIIMVKLMGLERLSATFGMVTLCQGLSSFIGSPVAGALSDSSGTFVNSFYMAGATLTLSGLITLPLSCVARWENGRKEKKSLDNMS